MSGFELLPLTCSSCPRRVRKSNRYRQQWCLAFGPIDVEQLISSFVKASLLRGSTLRTSYRVNSSARTNRRCRSWMIVKATHSVSCISHTFTWKHQSILTNDVSRYSEMAIVKQNRFGNYRWNWLHRYGQNFGIIVECTPDAIPT